MNRSTLVISLLALGLSMGAVTLGVWNRVSRPPRSAAAALPADVTALEQKVDLLTRQMEAVKVGLSVRALAEARPGPGGTPAPAPELPASLTALSQRLAELEQQTQVARERGMLPGPLSADAFAAATNRVLDRNAPLRDRVRALRQLRPVDGRADGRTPEVTTAMIELLQSPGTPPEGREEIVRNIEGVDLPALKDPLLAIAAGKNDDSDTRSEAVESLQPFYSDPQVFATITRLKESDPDPKVRHEADRRLREWQERRR